MRMPVRVAKSPVRIRTAESLRVPEQGSSAQGKSGPKPRPKGVGDGQSVEIPIPHVADKDPMGGRRRAGTAGDWMCPSNPVGSLGREIPPGDILSGDGERNLK